jgi:hypothetical protein
MLLLIMSAHRDHVADGMASLAAMARAPRAAARRPAPLQTVCSPSRTRVVAEGAGGGLEKAGSRGGGTAIRPQRQVCARPWCDSSSCAGPAAGGSVHAVQHLSGR